MALTDGIGGLYKEVPSLQNMFEEKRDVYRGILGDPEEQLKNSQSQALFTIANFGLQLAGATGGRVGASFGEKLAQAAQGSQLFPSISAISQQQRAEQQKLDLAALTSAEKQRTDLLSAKAAAEKAAQERESSRNLKIMEIEAKNTPFDAVSDDGIKIRANERQRYNPKTQSFDTVVTVPTDSKGRPYATDIPTGLDFLNVAGPDGTYIYTLKKGVPNAQPQPLIVGGRQLMSSLVTNEVQTVERPDGNTQISLVRSTDKSPVPTDQGGWSYTVPADRDIREMGGVLLSIDKKGVGEPKVLRTTTPSKVIQTDDRIIVGDPDGKGGFTNWRTAYSWTNPREELADASKIYSNPGSYVPALLNRKITLIDPVGVSRTVSYYEAWGKGEVPKGETRAQQLATALENIGLPTTRLVDGVPQSVPPIRLSPDLARAVIARAELPGSDISRRVKERAELDIIIGDKDALDKKFREMKDPNNTISLLDGLAYYSNSNPTPRERELAAAQAASDLKSSFGVDGFAVRVADAGSRAVFGGNIGEGAAERGAFVAQRLFVDGLGAAMKELEGKENVKLQELLQSVVPGNFLVTNSPQNFYDMSKVYAASLAAATDRIEKSLSEGSTTAAQMHSGLSALNTLYAAINGIRSINEQLVIQNNLKP